jgi:hypothetical protein
MTMTMTTMMMMMVLRGWVTVGATVVASAMSLMREMGDGTVTLTASAERDAVVAAAGDDDDGGA